MELQDEAAGMAINHHGRVIEMAQSHGGIVNPLSGISASAAFCAYWINVVP